MCLKYKYITNPSGILKYCYEFTTGVVYGNSFTMSSIEQQTDTNTNVFMQESGQPVFGISGTYYVDAQDKLVHHAYTNGFCHTDLPYIGRIEHIDYQKIYSFGNEDTVNSAFFGNIHPDEGETTDIVQSILSTISLPRISALSAHPYAEIMGRRDAVIPWKRKEIDLPSDVIWMSDTKEVQKGDPSAAKGIKVDLNRQFFISENAQTFEEAIHELHYPQAKLCARLLQDSPSLRTLFSFHEDLEFGNMIPDRYWKEGDEQRAGYYMYYYLSGGHGNLQRKQMIHQLHDETVRQLSLNGFGVFNGIDDLTDPYLGYRSINGCIADDKKHLGHPESLNGSFEEFAVETGKRNLSKITASFAFEIPGKMSYEQKQQMLGILIESFILPFTEFEKMF
jgi:hypothetical protein